MIDMKDIKLNTKEVLPGGKGAGGDSCRTSEFLKNFSCRCL